MCFTKMTFEDVNGGAGVRVNRTFRVNKRPTKGQLLAIGIRNMLTDPTFVQHLIESGHYHLTTDSEETIRAELIVGEKQ